ncbi:MAG: FAD binding domain-containing protein, partial [Thermodesulfobacteriota bacterium]
MRWRSYLIVRDVEELIGRLAEAGGSARVVAGGTDLLVQIKERETQEEKLTLLDVSRIEEMRTIAEAGSDLVVGAAATMAEIAASPLVQAKARALA